MNKTLAKNILTMNKITELEKQIEALQNELNLRRKIAELAILDGSEGIFLCEEKDADLISFNNCSKIFDDIEDRFAFVYEDEDGAKALRSELNALAQKASFLRTANQY